MESPGVVAVCDRAVDAAVEEPPQPTRREKLDEVARELLAVLQYHGTLSWVDLRRLLAYDPRRSYDAVNVLIAAHVLRELPQEGQRHKPPLSFGDGRPLPGVVPLQQILPQCERSLCGALAAQRRGWALRWWGAMPEAMRVADRELSAALDADETDYRALLSRLRDPGNTVRQAVQRVELVRGACAGLALAMCDAPQLPAALRGRAPAQEALARLRESARVDQFVAAAGDQRACWVAYQLCTVIKTTPPLLVREGRGADFMALLGRGEAELRELRALAEQVMLGASA